MLSILFFSCAPSGMPGGKDTDANDGDGESGISDTTDSPRDTGDSADSGTPPFDTSVSCSPEVPAATWVGSETETLCQDWLDGLQMTDDGLAWLVADKGQCEGHDSGGLVYSLDPSSLVANWTFEYPAAMKQLALAASRSGEGVFAIVGYGDDGLNYGTVDVRDDSDGALLARFHRDYDEIDMFWDVVFADDTLAVTVQPHSGGDGQVGIFTPPFTTTSYWRDAAAAVITQPSGTCCYFGEQLHRAGDVTGDGVDDLVAVGGGSWVLDGEWLDVDGPADWADPIPLTGSDSQAALGGIGDIDGDGIGDISALTESDMGIWVQVVAGGDFHEEARIIDDTHDGEMGDAVTGAGPVEGFAYDAMALTYEDFAGPGFGGNEIWLVGGPLCGYEVLRDVGVQVVTPDGEQIQWLTGHSGTLLGTDFVDIGKIVSVPL